MNKVRNFLDQARWAWQRVVRGWDDRVIWSIDLWLVERLPIWLRELKNSPHQFVPASLIPFHTDDWEEDEEELDRLYQEWLNILDEMIEGFEAAQKLIDNNFAVWDECRDLEQERYGRMLLPWNEGDTDKWHAISEEVNLQERLIEEREAATYTFQKGMRLFTRHFFDLWT